MTHEWISDEAAVERLQQDYGVPPQVAKNWLTEAAESNKFPTRDTITRVVEDPADPETEPHSRYRAEYIPQRLGLLGMGHYVEVRFDELRWQIEQQHGKPKSETQQQPNASAEPAPDAVPAPKGRLDVRPATKEMIEMREALSQAGTIRPGMSPREEHVLVLKGLNKTDEDYGYGRETYRTKVYRPAK